MELLCRNGKKVWNPNLTLTFDPLTLKSIKILLGSLSNTFVKYHHRLKYKFDLDLLTPKSIRSSSGHCQHMCEVLSLYAKRKWSYRAETVKKIEVQIWPWPLTFWPLNRSTPRVMVNTCVKYHHFKSKWKGVIVQKLLFHLQTDRQTDIQGDRQPWWNQYLPPPPTTTTNTTTIKQLRWRGYKKYWPHFVCNTSKRYGFSRERPRNVADQTDWHI